MSKDNEYDNDRGGGVGDKGVGFQIANTKHYEEQNPNHINVQF